MAFGDQPAKLLTMWGGDLAEVVSPHVVEYQRPDPGRSERIEWDLPVCVGDGHRVICLGVVEARPGPPLKRDRFHRRGLQAESERDRRGDCLGMVEHSDNEQRCVASVPDLEGPGLVGYLPPLLGLAAPGQTPLLIPEPDVGHE